jgi:uncharacterized protein YrrD
MLIQSLGRRMIPKTVPKETIKVETNPFGIRTKNVNTTEDPLKGVNVTQLAKLITSCRKNSVFHIELPGGLIIDLEHKRKVVESPSDEKRKRSEICQKARQARAQKHAERKNGQEEIQTSGEEKDVTDDDIMFWSSTPGGVPIR